MGLVAVFIGLRNAWHTHSTTAPLILGGFLLTLALAIGPDLSEISGRYRDAEFKFVRGRALSAAEAIRTIAGTVVDAQTKIQLEEIAVEVAREPQRPTVQKGTGLTELARRFQRLIWSEAPATVEQPIAYDDVEDEEARRTYFEQLRSGYDWSRGVTDWGVPTPTYLLYAERENDDPTTWRFVANPSWWGDWRVECHVRDPDGRTSAAVFYGSSGMQQYTFHVQYPGGFPDAPAIDRPGEYVFAWRRVGEERTVLAQDTVVVTEEMVDPAVLDGVEEAMAGTGYREKHWIGEAPAARQLEDAQRDAETRLDVERIIFSR
jgi:hypothetical protein